MSGYFSNQSQSRFIPTATTQSTQSAPAGESTTPSSRKPTPSAASSKLFSTTVNAAPLRAKSKSKESLTSGGGSRTPNEGIPMVHPLRHTWVFWFRQQRTPGKNMISYEEGIKRISSFSSVESFMTLYTHLTPPSQLQPTTDYLLFHSLIHRPVWEDPLNITGGKWIIRLKKGIADRLWEDLCFAVVGDQFDECSSGSASPLEPGDTEGNGDMEEKAKYPEICGCTISVRQHEDIVSLWNRVEVDMALREKIKETLKRVLNLPPSTIMEYKTNNDSFQDKSSFRTVAPGLS